jgi:hypothetical protein
MSSPRPPLERFCVVDYSSYHGCKPSYNDVIKELAVCNGVYNRCESWIFRPPYPEDRVGSMKCGINEDLCEKVVKIKWNDGTVPYYLLSNILEAAVANTDYIIVAGLRNIGKAKILSGFLQNRKISVLDVDTDSMDDVTSIICKSHETYFYAKPHESTQQYSGYDRFEKAHCPLNRCLKTFRYIQHELGMHKIPLLQQTQNNGKIPSVPRNLVKQMKNVDCESLKKLADSYIVCINKIEPLIAAGVLHARAR